MLKISEKVLSQIEKRAFNGKQYLYTFLSKSDIKYLRDNGFFVRHYKEMINNLYFVGWSKPKSELAEYCKRISEGELDGVFNGKKAKKI